MKKNNLQETKSARVIQVIETVSLAGDGTDAHPVYEVRQYWSPNGNLLAKSGSPEMEQNLSDFSTAQLVEELVRRNGVTAESNWICGASSYAIVIQLKLNKEECPPCLR